jgi:hypothetical protein
MRASDFVTEKKKRRGKNKSKSAAWGPGPYGWYGYNTGYSGDGGGDGGGGESIQHEASYEGNIGAMETFKFYQMATEKEKALLKLLIKKGNYKLAWYLIQKVTGVKLKGKEFELSEAPLADYVPMGDFDKPGPFRGADKKLVVHPTNQIKAQKFFEKTPYDFRLFFSNISGTGKYSEYGAMSPNNIKEIFQDQADAIINGHDNAITVVFVGNKGDSKVPMTPWIMAHRFGHAIQATNRMGGWSAWKEVENLFFRTVNSMLEEYYGKDSNSTGSNSYGQVKWNMTPEYNALFNAIGTQRSSRRGEIRRPYEFLYEIFAQYLGTGSVTFNALPNNLGYGRQAWGTPTKYLRLKSEYADDASRREMADQLANDMKFMFDDVLSNSVGKIFVM